LRKFKVSNLKRFHHKSSVGFSEEVSKQSSKLILTKVATILAGFAVAFPTIYYTWKADIAKKKDEMLKVYSTEDIGTSMAIIGSYERELKLKGKNSNDSITKEYFILIKENHGKKNLSEIDKQEIKNDFEVYSYWLERNRKFKILYLNK
jgi:hypothetical protein